MTRINLVQPVDLADQHLMAEYRELPMIAGSLRRSLNSKRGLPKIPERYCLGSHHVSFFYDKGLYLYNRYLIIVEELHRRNYQLSTEREVDFDTFKDNSLYRDWRPDGTDLLVITERIRERIDMKPDWYRYYGNSIHNETSRLYNPRLVVLD